MGSCGGPLGQRFPVRRSSSKQPPSLRCRGWTASSLSACPRTTRYLPCPAPIWTGPSGKLRDHQSAASSRSPTATARSSSCLPPRPDREELDGPVRPAVLAARILPTRNRPGGGTIATSITTHRGCGAGARSAHWPSIRAAASPPFRSVHPRRGKTRPRHAAQRFHFRRGLPEREYIEARPAASILPSADATAACIHPFAKAFQWISALHPDLLPATYGPRPA